MIQKDRAQNSDSKQVHMENLFRVVQYCENQTECRRVQVLHYFGETNFDSSHCRAVSETTCDNCQSSLTYTNRDVREDATAFVEAVNSIIHKGNRNWRRPVCKYTLNHLVDIFKVQLPRKKLVLLWQLLLRHSQEQLFSLLLLLLLLRLHLHLLLLLYFSLFFSLSLFFLSPLFFRFSISFFSLSTILFPFPCNLLPFSFLPLLPCLYLFLFPLVISFHFIYSPFTLLTKTFLLAPSSSASVCRTRASEIHCSWQNRPVIKRSLF